MENLANDFDAIVTNISNHLKLQGIDKVAYSQNRRFHTLEQERQKATIKRVRLQLEQMELMKTGMKEPEKLNLVAKYHSLRPVTDDVYMRLEMEQPWEIIDFQLNQLYRSKFIFDLGNYTIEDYETYSPWELFVRPQSSLKDLMRVTEELKTSKNLIDLRNIPPYIIQEAISEAGAQYEISHDFACPLVDSVTGENKAFISAFKSKKIHPDLKNKVIILN